MKKLSDICISISSGLTPLRSNRTFWNSKDVPWIKTEQIGEYLISDANEYVSKQAIEGTSLKINKKGTISLAMYGEGKTRGSVSILGLDAATNQACCNLVVDNDKANRDYVYYWLKANYKNLRSISSGVRNNLSVADISNFPFLEKSIYSQNKIGELLSNHDLIIENNNKAIAKLNELLSLIYNYWFTQFDFPDENGKPYKSSGGKMVWNEKLKREIPEGWELSNIKENFNITTGKRDANFATKDGKYTFFTCSDKVFKGDEKSFEGKSILLAGNGNFNVKAYNGEFDAYQRTYVIQPKNDSDFGLGYLSVKIMSEHFNKSSAGSIVKFITISDVENISFFKQKDVDVEIFNVLLEKILLSRKENEELIRQRDFLLPLLMNGQVTLK